MKKAMRGISALIGLVFLGVAVKFGMEGSWGTAVLFFLLCGGAEMAAYAMGAPIATDRED